DAKHTEPVNVLLLTDGGEDTQPRRDPVKAAALLGSLKTVRLHIVGFDINQPEWTEQLQAMARGGRGQYWPAARAADLERGLSAGALGLPENYVVLDAAGHEVARAPFAQPVSPPEGQYR